MSAKGVLLPILLACVVMLAWGPMPSGAAPSADALGPEFQISTPSLPIDAERHWPAVAHSWGHHEYLVVWHNKWPTNLDIYAQRVSETGQLVGPWFAVSYGADDRFNAELAYNATNDEYLVVWEREVAPNVTEVWGRRLKWNGADMGLPQYAEFKIFSWPNRGFKYPRVAWNSIHNEYLVVWSAYDTGTSVHTDVAGIRVLADGSMPDPHFIVSNVGQPEDADIVYNLALDRYLVVWARDGGTTDYDIYGVLLDRNGAKITPPGEFAVNASVSAQKAPAVTTNEQDRYMVVWQDFDDSYTPGDWDIYGRLFQADGSPATASFLVAYTRDSEAVPGVAANGADEEYLTVWHRLTDDGRVKVGTRLRKSDGTMLPRVDIPVPQGWSVAAPAVACDVPGFLIAYEKGSSVVPGHIYGRKWWPEVTFVPLALKVYT